MRPKNLEKEKAIKTLALQIIAEEGLENLSMQKLAKAANISPRTIYIKYENKEDLLIKLFIEEVLVAYEAAILLDFNSEMDFAVGIHKLWANTFSYLTNNKHAYALIKYGKSSPLLHKAYQQANIKEGDYFGPFMQFIERNIKKGIIREFPPEVYRALLSAPIFELAGEYIEHEDRAKQIITQEILTNCCDAVIKGLLI